MQIKMCRHYQTNIKISNQCMKFSDEELLYIGLLGISFQLLLFQGISWYSLWPSSSLILQEFGKESFLQSCGVDWFDSLSSISWAVQKKKELYITLFQWKIQMTSQ